MRHKVAGYKLGRTTSHRRAMLRNMVTSIIMEERIETTVIKAKAVRPQVEKMITLGKKGDLAARRQAASYLMTDEAVRKLFDTVAPRFGDRNGGYLRIIRTAWRKGDGAEKAFIELLGSLPREDFQKAHSASVSDALCFALASATIVRAARSPYQCSRFCYRALPAEVPFHRQGPPCQSVPSFRDRQSADRLQSRRLCPL